MAILGTILYHWEGGCLDDNDTDMMRMMIVMIRMIMVMLRIRNMMVIPEPSWYHWEDGWVHLFQRWANNSVFEYYSNTWGRILVFVFVFGWLFETKYYSHFLKPNIICIRIWVIFQTEYYSYSYSGDFLKPNTAGIFFWILWIFCWALILLMSGPQSFINGHMKICHHTFTFLMTGSTNLLKKWVGECSSLSTQRCQMLRAKPAYHPHIPESHRVSHMDWKLFAFVVSFSHQRTWRI